MSEYLERWKHPESYFGKQYDGYFIVIGRHRDSSILENSNFDKAWEMLNGFESTIDPSFNHWAVGWSQLILVHESDHEGVKEAEGIVCSLSDYPILDEEDCSEREYAFAQESWSCMRMKDRIELCKKARISIFASRRDYIPKDDNGSIYEYCRSEY